jgi:hypothetical protein
MLYNNRATNHLIRRPNCDMCPPGIWMPAEVDGETNLGPWAYMCRGHFDSHGLGLGIGVGQVLLCDDDKDTELIAHYNLGNESRRGGVSV